MSWRRSVGGLLRSLATWLDPVELEQLDDESTPAQDPITAEARAMMVSSPPRRRVVELEPEAPLEGSVAARYRALKR
jgi:hypothetical protein